MRFTKFGHSCVLVEEGSARILFDPGRWSMVQDTALGLHAIIITHSHGDHCDSELIAKLVADNQGVVVYSNADVKEKLQEVVSVELLEDGGSRDIQGVLVQGIGSEHAFFYENRQVPPNVAYIVAGFFLHPGDSLQNTPDGIEILALPAGAPWMKQAEALDYARKVSPRSVFPIHDKVIRAQTFNKHYVSILGEHGIQVVTPEDGESFEL